MTIEERRQKLLSEAYDIYAVALQCTGKIFGGIPLSAKPNAWLVEQLNMEGIEELEAKAIREKIQKVAVDAERAVESLHEEVARAMAEKQAELTVGFRKNGKGPFLGAHQILAVVRDAFQGLEIHKKMKGWGVYMKRAGLVVLPDEIPMLRDGKVVEAVDGVEMIAGHVMGAQGPRSIVRFYEYVDSPRVEFHIRVPSEGKMTEDLLFEALVHGEKIGLGSARGMGFGKYEVVEFEKVDG